MKDGETKKKSYTHFPSRFSKAEEACKLKPTKTHLYILLCVATLSFCPFSLLHPSGKKR